MTGAPYCELATWFTGTSSNDGRRVPWYRGANVPLRVIRRFARQVAEQFQPDKIILFGSHAYGQPHADRDVDILVVMPARNQLDQAAKIHLATLPPFPLHPDQGMGRQGRSQLPGGRYVKSSPIVRA